MLFYNGSLKLTGRLKINKIHQTQDNYHHYHQRRTSSKIAKILLYKNEMKGFNLIPIYNKVRVTKKLWYQNKNRKKPKKQKDSLELELII